MVLLIFQEEITEVIFLSSHLEVTEINLVESEPLVVGVYCQSLAFM